MRRPRFWCRVVGHDLGWPRAIGAGPVKVRVAECAVCHALVPCASLSVAGEFAPATQAVLDGGVTTTARLVTRTATPAPPNPSDGNVVSLAGRPKRSAADIAAGARARNEAVRAAIRAVPERNGSSSANSHAIFTARPGA